MSEIRRIEGGLAVDDRGSLAFVNNFNFQNVKRFYHIVNFSTETIRAFHGHKKEEKYFYVANGSLILAGVKIDNFDKPAKNLRVERLIVSARKPEIVHFPTGYANGFRALEPHTHLIVFSNATIEESRDDDFRYSADYWGEAIWKVENR